MPTKAEVLNDVYERYGLKWVNFPNSANPFAHSDEAELFCAQQSLVVYGVHPDNPVDPDHDHVPSLNSAAISDKTFDFRRMIEGGAEEGGRGERGYFTVRTDQAAALGVWNNLHVVIAFRGTANWQDWIHNFTTQQIAPPECVATSEKYRLHKGFYGLAANLFPAVADEVYKFVGARNAEKKEVCLTLCGHSLGGALALNFGSMWRQRHEYYRYHSPQYYDSHDKIRVFGTYTFGAPRLGGGEIWRAIARPHYRLIVRGDGVPWTPPGCDDDFQATFLEKPDLPPTQPGILGMLRKAGGAVVRRTNLDFAKSHAIESYVQSIERKLKLKKSQP